MNGVDVALGLALFLFALRGFWRGLARELLGLIGVGLGIALGLAFAPAMAGWLKPYLPLAVGKVLGFVALFTLTDIAANLLAMGLETMAGLLLFSLLNRSAGALFGALKGAVLLAALLMVADTYLPSTPLSGMLQQSTLGPRLEAIAEAAAEAVGLQMKVDAEGFSDT